MATVPDSDLEYLSPEFDPSTLTIPKLRGILVAHSVAFPSSAKKGQLIDIFNENVVPQAKKILGARSRTKRSARGIVDVPSSQEPSVSDDESDQERNRVTAESQTPRAASRKRQRKSAEETSPGRSASTTKPPKSEQRRSRKSMVPIEVKQETGEVVSPRPGHDESPFSADNPFQSGSSPLPPLRSPSGESRRRTLGSEVVKERRKRSTSRRKTDIIPNNSETASDNLPATSKRFTVPLSQVYKSGDDVPAGEEFTPQERQALALEERRTGPPLRPAKRRKTGQTSSFAKLAPWAISLAMIGGLGAVWRQEKVSVGFCGIGRPSEVLAGVEIPAWADPIRPQCEPCPPHAYCDSDLQASCEPGFVLVPHPLSLGGVVPLPPTCEPDGEKARKVQAVADRAVSQLRERNAQVECGELKDDHGKRVTTAEIEEAELKEQVASKRRKGMSQAEFEELWEPALGEMMARDEIVSDANGQTGRRTLRSVSLANISLSCAIRRSVRHALARHLWKLVALALAVGGVFIARSTIMSGREAESKAKQLASFALDRLAAQAALHIEDPSRAVEPWISMSQLRDDVLRDEFSSKRRQLLWEKVQRKVEDNANVRSSVKEGRSGEIGRVWEWIGAVDFLADGSAKRKSGRYSMGPETSGTPQPVKAEPEMIERSPWSEGRPIY